MQDAADDEDVVRLDADEEKPEKDAEDDDEDRNSDEDRRRLERSRQYAVEVGEAPVADQVSAEVDELAELVEANEADAWAAQSVANPLRLGEYDYVDDQETEGQQRPRQTEAVSTASVDFHRFTRHRLSAALT